jgi:hypothetical protein
MRSLLIFSALLGLSCGPARYVNPHPVRLPAVRVRVETDAVLNARHVSGACDVWSPVGVVCEMVYVSAKAEIVVRADYQRCPTTNGGKVFAVAESCQITVFMDCFFESGVLDGPLLRRILAHELGHGFGIDHVPRECDSGRTICGEALMNSMPDLSYITSVDAKAYEAASRNCKFR